PEGTMNEDFVQAMMAATAGWRVVYAPDAISLERASATPSDELTRRSRLVTGRGQALVQLVPGMLRRQPGLALKLISHKGLRPLVPLWMLAALVSNALLAVDHLWAKALLAAQLAFYLLAGLGWLADIAGKRNKFLFIPYYFCRANLATLRGLWQFATGRHEAVWQRVSRA
ncbi:MAG: glycosyltransferase family 2 protein, partial [Gaiellaceae bacterium]